VAPNNFVLLSVESVCAEQDVAAHVRKIRMLDVILLALGLGFLVLAIGYTIACDRL
jgi:hypothetical protein